ncbi:hypothetical protein [Aneurinibacillus migulanus]|uniref:hypothetical protein n=1 Tax=Aneurinibacillus migulanus TaxID=47500 RepID=UPI001F245F95|nr:hypothetical protein [Aneurinibacillus migulanus]
MINRQMFMGEVRKEGRARAGGKTHAGLSSVGSQGASNLFFFPNPLLPTTLPCQTIKCNLYRKGFGLINRERVH